MNPGLRARAAAAALGLFGFNPHQLRGPDGRFIKMPDSMLKRPRRKPKRAAGESGLYRRRRERFNEEILADARQQREAFDNPKMYPQVPQVEAMQPGPERDALIDEIVEAINNRSFDTPYVAPTRGGPQEVARRAATATRPGPDAPYAQRQAALAESVASGAYDEEKLAQGAMGETRRFDLADGTQAVYKRHLRDWNRGYDKPVWTKKDQTDAEELGASVAAALGVRVPAVHRAGENELYMEFVDGQIGEARWPHRGGVPPRGVLTGPQGRRIGLLDVLIENTDRHGGNYLVDDADNITAIDHGLGFSRTFDLDEQNQPVRRATGGNRATGDFALAEFISPGGRYQTNNPLTGADVERLRDIVEGLRPEFDRLGRGGWWLSMRERVEHLARNASGYEDVL